MPSDMRIARARELHRKAHKLQGEAQAALTKRNNLIREVYRDGGWSYKTLSEKLGVSSELIAHIIKGRVS